MERRTESSNQQTKMIDLDRTGVINNVFDVVHARRQDAWINARESAPADRSNSRRSIVEWSARPNVKSEPSKAAKTRTSTGSFRDRNLVRLSMCPDLSADLSGAARQTCNWEQIRIPICGLRFIEYQIKNHQF